MMQRKQILRLFLLAVVLILVGSMLAISGFTLWRLRSEALTNGLENSAMHSRGFEDLLTQSLRLTALITANNMESERPRSDPRHLSAAFATTLRHAPFLRSLSLLDEHGQIIASSNLANLGRSVATDDYLPPLNDDLDILRIGRPWAGRDFSDNRPSNAESPVLPDEQSFIPITQRLVTREGTITLLIALNPDFFINHFSQKLDPREGVVDVLRYDGTLLMTTAANTATGIAQDASLHGQRLAEEEFGTFEQNTNGSRPALSSFRASRLYPLVVVTRIDRDYALRHWKAESITLLSVTLPVLLGITLLSLAYYRRQMLTAAQQAESARLKGINATVFDFSSEATLITDLDAIVVSVNPAFTRVTEFAPDEIIGRPLLELLTEDGIDAFNERLAQRGRSEPVADDGSPLTVEVQQRCKDGTLIWMEILSTPEHDARGRLIGYRRISRNITERRHMEDQVRQLAFHDPLTQLPNRRLLNDRLNQAMAASKRSGCYGAVIFLDLDNFKPLNDVHGHVAGDLLLIEAAARLTSCVREMDTVARFGGDEFVVILGALHRSRSESIQQARNVAEKISSALARPYRLPVAAPGMPPAVIEHVCTSSLGVSLFINHESSQDDVLKWADSAMYQSKNNGRNQIRFHDPVEQASAGSEWRAGATS